MNVLVIFGRAISSTAIENLKLLQKLSNSGPEYAFLQEATWCFLYSDLEYREAFGAIYFDNTLRLKTLSIKNGDNMSPTHTVYKLHPRPNKLSLKAAHCFRDILYHLRDTCSMLVTADDTGRGRPAFALRAARNMFLPSLDLAHKSTNHKLRGLLNDLESRADKDRKLLVKYVKQLQVNQGIEFKLSDKVDQLERESILNYIEILKGIL